MTIITGDQYVRGKFVGGDKQEQDVVAASPDIRANEGLRAAVNNALNVGAPESTLDFNVLRAAVSLEYSGVAYAAFATIIATQESGGRRLQTGHYVVVPATEFDPADGLLASLLLDTEKLPLPQSYTSFGDLPKFSAPLATFDAAQKVDEAIAIGGADAFFGSLAALTSTRDKVILETPLIAVSGMADVEQQSVPWWLALSLCLPVYARPALSYMSYSSKGCKPVGALRFVSAASTDDYYRDSYRHLWAEKRISNPAGRSVDPTLYSEKLRRAYSNGDTRALLRQVNLPASPVPASEFYRVIAHAQAHGRSLRNYLDDPTTLPDARTLAMMPLPSAARNVPAETNSPPVKAVASGARPDSSQFPRPRPEPEIDNSPTIRKFDDFATNRADSRTMEQHTESAPNRSGTITGANLPAARAAVPPPSVPKDTAFDSAETLKRGSPPPTEGYSRALETKYTRALIDFQGRAGSKSAADIESAKEALSWMVTNVSYVILPSIATLTQWLDSILGAITRPDQQSTLAEWLHGLFLDHRWLDRATAELRAARLSLVWFAGCQKLNIRLEPAWDKLQGGRAPQMAHWRFDYTFDCALFLDAIDRQNGDGSLDPRRVQTLFASMLFRQSQQSGSAAGEVLKRWLPSAIRDLGFLLTVLSSDIDYADPALPRITADAETLKALKQAPNVENALRKLDSNKG